MERLPFRMFPPGGYELSVFHERATDASLRALDQHITVADSDLELPADCDFRNRLSAGAAYQ